MNKYISGRVVSCSSDKTVLVAVERVRKHPIYGCATKRRRKIMVHDEHNKCQIGQIIKAKLCAPISKRKSYCLVEKES